MLCFRYPIKCKTIFFYRQSNANADDFTLSYLDGMVVSALEKSGAFAEVEHSVKQSYHPYLPNKCWKLREKLKKEKEVK